MSRKKFDSGRYFRNPIFCLITREYIHLVFYNAGSSIDEFFAAIAWHPPQGPQARISELGAVGHKDKESVFLRKDG